MKKSEKAVLPNNYDTYIFDLYGTLVDISTNENATLLWEKLALFYGYYGANYSAKELHKEYELLVTKKESCVKTELQNNTKYSYEAYPEIDLSEVFEELFLKKGVTPSPEIIKYAGQFFRILSTEHIKLYPGTKDMLARLKSYKKRIFLLSNAQRIFTENEMRFLDIYKYFDAILISSDYQTKKPDKRFFDILINTYNIDVNKALFIGNDSYTDICGAKGVMLDTFYVKSNISPKNDNPKNADYIVDNFERWE